MQIEPSAEAFAARYQRGEPQVDRGELGQALARGAVLVERRTHRRNEIGFVERLRQKIHRASLHRPHGRFDAAAAADEHDRPAVGRARQRLLQLEAAQARHGKVHDDAPGGVGIALLEEGLRRRIGVHLEPARLQQAVERPQDQRVVIDDADARPCTAHAGSQVRF